jgi:hypothetical protein
MSSDSANGGAYPKTKFRRYLFAENFVIGANPLELYSVGRDLQESGGKFSPPAHRKAGDITTIQASAYLPFGLRPFRRLLGE